MLPRTSSHNIEATGNSSPDSASTLVNVETSQQKGNWFKRHFSKKTSASSAPVHIPEHPWRSSNVPCLNTLEQADARLLAQEESGNISHQTNYFKRMRWAYSHMKTLKDLIDKLRDANNDLTSLVESIAFENPAKSLPSFPQMDRLWPVVTSTEKVLHQIHLRLMNINVATKDGGPYFFALQLFEDFADNRADFEMITREDWGDSFIFNIQKHASKLMNDPDTDLLVLAAAQGDVGKTRSLVDLNPPTEPTRINETSLELWGQVGVSEGLTYLLHRSTDVSWSSRSTLADILNDGAYHANAKPQQILQLARLILCAHLYLERILQDHPRLRLQDYRYYEINNQQLGSDDDSPLFLSPFLSVGFGSRPPPPVMGKRRGVTQAPSNTMVEIGLVLYQIGIGKTIEYGQGSQGLQETRDRALRSLDQLDRRVGAIYTEVVHQFLEFHQPPQYLLNANDQRRASEQIKRSISALMKLEESMANAVTAAIQEPKVQRESPQPVETLQDIPEDVPQGGAQSVTHMPVTTGVDI